MSAYKIFMPFEKVIVVANASTEWRLFDGCY
jgi:hypothetical protein